MPRLNIYFPLHLAYYERQLQIYSFIMFLILKYIAKLLKAMASEASPGQLAGGFILGMIIGLTPVGSFHNLIVLLLIIILKVNFGMALLSFLVFSGVAYLADPLFHALGTSLLESASLQNLWTAMYNNEWVAVTHFYNTVVLGSLVAALVLCIPAYPLVVFVVKEYREHILARMNKWKVVQALKGTKLWSVYQGINRVRG